MESSNAGDPRATAGELFELLWDNLADLMGTGATATLLRRAAKHAAARDPALGGLVIERDGLQYRYELPEAWRRARDDLALAGLRALACALRPLLLELTGPVVVNRLARLDPLREAGVFAAEEEAG